MGMLAPALAIAGTGMQILGGMQAASAQAAGYRHAEAQAQRRALAARTAADQTSAFLRDELDTTLGNIRAVRAAAGVGDSPTEQALIEKEKDVSEYQRAIKVGNLRSQATTSEADAAFYKFAAGSALSSGYIGAFGKGLTGFSGIKF